MVIDIMPNIKSLTFNSILFTNNTIRGNTILNSNSTELVHKLPFGAPTPQTLRIPSV